MMNTGLKGGSIMQRIDVTRLATLLALLACSSACVTTRYTLINPSAERYASVPPDSVVILTDEAELDTLEYTRIAIIEATGSGEFTKQTDMINAMRKRAAEVGANAILLPRIDEPGAGAKVAAAVFGTGTERKGNVVAIRILGRKQQPDTHAAVPRRRSRFSPAAHVLRARRHT